MDHEVISDTVFELLCAVTELYFVLLRRYDGFVLLL